MGALGESLYRALFDAWPTPGLLLDTELVIVDANPSYLQTLGRERADLVGRHVLDAFPDAEGRASTSLLTSMRTALQTGLPDRLPLLAYPTESADGSGHFQERWWGLVNIALTDEAGRPVALLNVVEDLTQVVREQEGSRLARAVAEDLRRHTEELSTDLAARHRDLTAVRHAESRSSLRLAALAEVALELPAAETVEELTDIVVQGLAVLGADGGAVGVRDESSSTLRLYMTDTLGADAQQEFREIPLHSPLPAAVAARTGRPILLTDRAAGLAFAAEMANVHATADNEAWAALPLRVESRLLGSITVGWKEAQDFADDDLALMHAFAAQCAQSLGRLLQRQAERATATVVRQMSEALQRSLLTDPVQPDHLEIAVRYLPAAHEVQVGGDWYDAFLVADGSTQLVVGDVSGHGRHAAATMAQIRNVLRGVAHALVDPPAAVLSALDRAMADLAVGTLVTAILAKIEQTPQEAAAGLRTLRWANAGHPPPLLIDPDGTVRLLTRPVDRLLGVTPDVARHDHSEVLQPGATVLLYTDGLVERRGVPLDEGFEWLRVTTQRLAAQHLTLEQLCDALLGDLSTDVDDDVVLLAVRAHNEDRPRPATAGPSVLPPDLRGDTDTSRRPHAGSPSPPPTWGW